MGYGGYDRAAKPGALSGVYIQGYGVAILGQNHTAGDSNTVWGRARKPLFRVWRKADVNPEVFASCYAQPEISFHEKEKRYVIGEKIPLVPLEVTRTLRFDGEKIHVRGEIRALADFDGRELNHSIPFASDGKRVRLFSAPGRRLWFCRNRWTLRPVPRRRPVRWRRSAGTSLRSGRIGFF